MASPFLGGTKFFKKSKCLFADGATIETTSSVGTGQLALDRNPITYWRSIGSDDTVTESMEVTFAEEITFDRLFLIDHNFKDFSVKYDVAGVWTDFASVVGLSGSQSNIAETSFADDTAYYQFTPVTTTKIQILVTKTQVVDAQKYINQIIVTEELGTLVGFPKIKGTVIDRNLRKDEMLSGKILVQKSEKSFKATLDFDDYPATLSADVDLIFLLQEYEDNFMIWLCGGRRGSQYFRKQMEGYRLRDVYTVQLVAPLDPIYGKNQFHGTVNFTAKFEEAVD